MSFQAMQLNGISIIDKKDLQIALALLLGFFPKILEV
jgi:hypothetical protein